MGDIEILSNKRLRRLIVETKTTLEQLKEELVRREQAKQEKGVAHLEDYMKDVEHNLKSIRNFVAYLAHHGEHK